MSLLVAMPLAEGGRIVFEAPEDLTPAGVTLAARPGDVIEQAGETIEAAIERALTPIAKALKAQFDTLKPDQVEVSLGLTLSAEAGLIISKMSGEAAISVTMSWSREQPSQP
ncbi:MAG: CU044_2847 family protein [Dehalococcoidia bacterium]